MPKIMVQAVLSTLFSWRGRIARSAFWWCGSSSWVAFAILFVFLDSSLGRSSTWILYPPFVWIVLSLMIKRLHDRGVNGWHLLWTLLPVLGPLWMIYSLAFRRGTTGDNQYGPDPLLVNVDYLTVQTP